MLTIDGSEGEGGGQVLRTRLPLSAVTGTPFENRAPLSIAHRELEVVRDALGLDRSRLEAKSLEQAHGRGNVITIELTMPDHTEVFTGFGAPGVPARDVAATAVEHAQEYLACGQPVSHYLADQLLIPLAMSGAGSFRTGPPSPHARTNLEMVVRFLPGTLTSEEVLPAVWDIRGAAHG
jgi:RNA 3'-terminal phosphate cyclase (ATP)